MVKLSPEQIESWVAQYFKYKKTKAGQLRINNPDGDTKYNLFIDTKFEKNRHGNYGNWVHDFRPNHQQYDGSFIRFVMNYLNVSFYKALSDVTGGSTATVKQAVNKARRKKQVAELETEEQEDEEEQLELPADTREFGSSDGSLEMLYLAYLYKRAMTPEIIERNKIQYTPSTIVFPYYEYDSVVYWQERSVADKRFNFPDEQKTGLAKTDYLYGFDNVEYGVNEVIVVESIFNALSLGINCVATCGAVMPDGCKQIKKLLSFDTKTIILAPDPDKAGYLSLRKNYFALRKLHKRIAYSFPPDDYDWNDLDQKFGIGSARKHLERNCFILNEAKLAKLSSRFKS